MAQAGVAVIEDKGVHFVICESCLAPYAWLPPRRGRKPHRIGGIGPPYPCPRCGNLQRHSRHEILARSHRQIVAGWLVLVSLLILFSAGVFVYSETEGIRPWGPWSAGLAAFVIASSLWWSRFRHLREIDPNENLEARKAWARKSALDSSVVPFEEFQTRLQDLALDPPAPPDWDWGRAASVMVSGPAASPKVFGWELWAGVAIAVILLASTGSYLSSTRIAWEFQNLDNPKSIHRWNSVSLLWNLDERGDRERLIDWFRRTALSSEEEQAFLSRLPRFGPENEYAKDLIEGVVRTHYGIPAAAASDLLQRFPDQTSFVLDRAVEVGPVAHPRLAVLAGIALGASRVEWLAKNISLDDASIRMIRTHVDLAPREWSQLAGRILGERHNEPAIWLGRLESLLANVPPEWWTQARDQAFLEITPMMVEWVAQNPGQYPHLLRSNPRKEWLLPLASILNRDKNRVEAVLNTLPIFDPIPESACAVSGTVTPASEEVAQLLAVAVLARHKPETSADLCGRILESFLTGPTETLDPEAYNRIQEGRAFLTEVVTVLGKTPMDSIWMENCAAFLRLPSDRARTDSVRQQWFAQFQSVDPDELLEGYRRTVEARGKVPSEELSAFNEFLEGHPLVTSEWAARRLVREVTAEEEMNRMPPILKLALLKYIEQHGDSSVVPFLTQISGDPTVLMKTRDESLSSSLTPLGATPENSTIRIGEFAAKIIQEISKRPQGVVETPPPTGNRIEEGNTVFATTP